MKVKRIATLFLIFLNVFTISCLAQEGHDDVPPKREFRAVWIATLANIDWPSRRDLKPEDQRKEFSELLDFIPV